MLCASASGWPLSRRWHIVRIGAKVKPSKILSVAPVVNSDPPAVHVELSCSLCGKTDVIVLSRDEADKYRQPPIGFYFICFRHRVSGTT